MADLGTPTTAAGVPTNGAARGGSPRQVTRRRTLPGSRAVVGGLLVAASAVGVFAAYDAANAEPSVHYVVVATEIAPGTRIAGEHLDVAAIDLPEGQRAVAFTDPALLVGSVATSRMVPGQLVQQSNVARGLGDADLAQISIPVAPGSALNGSPEFLRPDERVDVIVTYTRGAAPVTTTVAYDALVVRVLAADRSIGGSGLTVVLGVPADELEAIAGAAASGHITLARTTGLER